LVLNIAGRGAEQRTPAGWQAELGLRFVRRRDRTVLSERRQCGPLLVQRPFYPEDDGTCHTYLIHPPAGIVGGDDLRVDLDLEAGAHALVTTPAATRWYFSREPEASIRQCARIAAGATLEWLPQETLVYGGARAQLTTRIEVEAGARFLGWEVLGLGRPACGEEFRNGKLDFRFQIFRAGQPLLLERLRGDVNGVPGLRGYAAYATFVATGAGARALECAREVLRSAPDSVGAATLIGDVLIGRSLAERCEPLTSALNRLWSALRPVILGRPAVAPRIWRT